MAIAKRKPALPGGEFLAPDGSSPTAPFLGVDGGGEERLPFRLLDMVPALVWCLTPAGEPLHFNRRLAEWIGAATMQAAAHPDDALTLTEALDRSLKAGKSFSVKCRLRRRDGVYRWTEGRVEPMRDREGRIECWYGAFVDIDDQVRAEAALRQREHQLEQLIDAVPALIWSATPDGKVSYVNKRYRDYMGFSVTSAIEGVVHPDDRAAAYQRLERSCSTGEPFDMKYRQRRADGAYRSTHCRAEPLRDADGRIVQWYGVVADIEDEVQAQNALRCAQDRLARAAQASSLAELSASIAHEVNQPLAAVVANADACQRWLSADPPNIERARITCERIVRDANASSDVINGIRALFKQSTAARSLANINEVILEVGRLMSDEIETADLGVKYELDVGLAPMLMDRVQIQQVLVNLIRNATEALGPAQGERWLGIRSLRVANDQVRVEVVDRGRGLDDIERIFEPFFTTKPNGMGMGLAICRSIIEAHDGQLWAQRNEPTGTQLVFTLPIRAPEQG